MKLDFLYYYFRIISICNKIINQIYIRCHRMQLKEQQGYYFLTNYPDKELRRSTVKKITKSIRASRSAINELTKYSI